VKFDGVELTNSAATDAQDARRMQMIFQDRTCR